MEPNDTDRRAKRRGWRIALGCGLLVVCLFVAWPFVERYRGKSALAKYEQELKRKGEKFAYEELVPPPAEGENKYGEFLSICNSVQEGQVLILNGPPVIKMIAPGKVLPIAKEPFWHSYDKKKTFTWEEAAADLSRNRAVLMQLRTVLQSPVLSVPFEYRSIGVSTLFPHLAPTKKAAQWLSASSIYNVHVGDSKAAIDDIEAMMLLTRPSKDEPFLISQLVRYAVAMIAFNTSWAVLQSEQLTDAQLQRFQESLAAPDLISPMILALRGERIFCRESLRTLRSPKTDIDQFFSGQIQFGSDAQTSSILENLPYHEEIGGALRTKVIFPIWRFAWSYQDERHILEEMQTLIEAAGVAKTQRSAAAIKGVEQALENKCGPGGKYQSWRYWATSLLIPGEVKAIRRALVAENVRGLTIAAIALKRYQLRNGRLPNTLDEIVPVFVETHPIDWMDGQKLRYRREGKTFVLWSVGDDGEDDGGVPDQTSPFHFLFGPDLVWPEPASKEEIQKYYKEPAKD